MTIKKKLKDNPLNFIAMDCEGLCGADNICEITLTKYTNGIFTELRTYRFRPYLFPGEVNSFEHLKQYNTLPSIVEKWKEICRYTKKYLLISHNFNGDLHFFKRDMEHFNLTGLNFYGLCSEELSKKIFPKKHAKSGQLRKLCSKLGIPVAIPKSSISDSDLTAKLYIKCIEQINAKTLYDVLNITDLGLYCSDGKKININKK